MTPIEANFPLPVAGIRLGSSAAGIKFTERDDLVIIELSEGSHCAAVFTRNAFCAAPVTLAKLHAAQTPPRFLLINSGNANAGTGKQGDLAALECCQALATLNNCSVEQVLPFSTGVIGQPLPVSRLTAGLPAALETLKPDGWQRAARAIMTTDTVPKLRSLTFQLEGTTITLTGMVKGAGMICPDMATMLAYLATDAKIEAKLLQQCLESAVQSSFNSITVDGDTSTNDSCILMATGKADCPILSDADSASYKIFCDAVTQLCMALARDIIKDGEGATKLVEIQVSSAKDLQEAKQVGYTVAHSPLVKTALFASDPNWGRILAAVGRAGIQNLDINKIRILLDQVEIVSHGGLSASYTEEAGQAVMNQNEFAICIELGRGDASSTILTCDLSYDYVKINAEYRS